MAVPVLEARGLTKHYGTAVGLDGLDLTVARGEVLGFLGPNGAGKTTAMRLLTSFLRPDAGRIRVAGHDLATHSLAARQSLGYLPENAPAYGEMTVRGFLAFIAEARAVERPEHAIDRVVTETGLGKVVHQTIETLSKGFKRRVGLAQALIHDPEVLILDEPTDGLDPNQKLLVQQLIESLSANKCIILSTHILDEVERICNRALIISQGRILVDSTPEELVTRAPNHNLIRLAVREAAAEGLLERLEGQTWCERVENPAVGRFDILPAEGANHLSDLLAMLPAEAIESVRLEEGRLDDLFRDLTQGVSS